MNIDQIRQTITDEIRTLTDRITALTKAKDLLGGPTEAPTGRSGGSPAPTTRKRREHTKEAGLHRTAKGVLRGAILKLLRHGRLSVNEMVKTLEQTNYPFARRTNHRGCVNTMMARMRKERKLTAESLPGRGVVYSIARHKGTPTSALTAAIPEANKKFKRMTRKPQKGLTGRIARVLAEQGVTGRGLTATEVMGYMQRNGFNFTARNPYGSVTGLLRHLVQGNKVDIVPNSKPFRYKIRVTSELLGLHKKEGE